jgi:hypothetical protein
VITVYIIFIYLIKPLRQQTILPVKESQLRIELNLPFDSAM